MAFSITANTWNDERADRASWVLKPILGGYSMKYLNNKVYGIQGNNVLLPTFETTVAAQGGYSCGFTSSGTTTIAQKTITTVPFTIQEQICVRDLHQYFTVQTLPGGSIVEEWQMIDMWVNRKLQRAAQKLGMALWQGKTTYTNDTFLKLYNGIINQIDAASDEVVVTGGEAGTAITTSNVRTIFEEALFNGSTGLYAIPQILDQAVLFCGRDTFATLRLKLMQDNLYHVPVGNADSPDGAYSQWEMYYPGSTVKIVAIPELNNSNPVETGSLPTAVKNRLVLTYPDNIVVGMNAENDPSSFRLWYSQDDDVIKFNLRGFAGVKVLNTDLVVTY